jgi:hypothetical protein
MAGNAFGFSPYPQRPTVDPRTVGRALVQKKAQEAAPIPFGQGVDDNPELRRDRAVLEGAEKQHGTDARLLEQAQTAYGWAMSRNRGAIRRGAEMDSAAARETASRQAMFDARGNEFLTANAVERQFLPGFGADATSVGRDGGDQFEDSAIQAMRHERNRRVGMELEQGQQRVPANHDAQLRRLGMSDAEIRLLRQAGGIK